jgi:hypothetical protein
MTLWEGVIAAAAVAASSAYAITGHRIQEHISQHEQHGLVLRRRFEGWWLLWDLEVGADRQRFPDVRLADQRRIRASAWAQEVKLASQTEPAPGQLGQAGPG